MTNKTDGAMRMLYAYTAWACLFLFVGYVSTFVLGIDLTEKERVQFVTGDAAAELRRIKADGEGTVTAYGAETGALLLDNGLADEIVVITVPVLVGGGEKALECGLNDGRIWVVRSSKVLEDGKIRTVYGRVCP